MRRRNLLATLACAPAPGIAGCASDQECTGVEITDGELRVDYVCDLGPSNGGGVNGRIGSCEEALTLVVVEDGEVVGGLPIQPNESGRWQVEFDEDMGLSGESGEQTVRVRDSDGNVHAEKSIPVDHYEDRPDLGVVPVSLEPETVAIGESADVSFGVETFGGDAEFTAELLVNDTSVETREGSIDGGVDCEGFSGPEFEFSRTFEKAGEYLIAGRIEAESHPEAGDSQDVGTVTVTE
ncbi:hypothetical protein [Halorubrum sp. 48-1-W]|uniref:hypothetical protein n=1 Tax=Halorubrum sp. 48-1-W TaxID=2249761 RepID=UPI000FCB137A|nr:hypothetical protein [Halorubrum sp. 48-1-W]